MKQKILRTTQNKAFEINEENKIYGTFAEIGAGQEVARFFFQAGKASQTIAKTISAYDMIYSDEIYGKEANGRYVCESRLEKMLHKEFSLLEKRLKSTRGSQTCFFAYANTVATGDQNKRQPHGWMGIRFQAHPNGEFNDIVVHLRLLDRYRLLQQEALGVLGVNLVHAAFHATDQQRDTIDDFIEALVENLKEGQVVIDMIRFTGPDVAHFRNPLVNLALIRRGLTEAILFAPDKSILSLTDSFFGRPVIALRGNFRPLTNSHLLQFEQGTQAFAAAFPHAKSPITVFEVTMQALQGERQFSEQDFLDRVHALTSTGHHVLVSNFLVFHRLKHFLRQFTREPVGMIVGINLLPKIFNPEYYQDLEGGILEGLSKLLDSNSRLFVSPDRNRTQTLTAKSFAAGNSETPLFQHFYQQKWIIDLMSKEDREEFIGSEKIIEMIRSGDTRWRSYVPKQIANMIEFENLFQLVAPAKDSKNRTSV